MPKQSDDRTSSGLSCPAFSAYFIQRVYFPRSGMWQFTENVTRANVMPRGVDFVFSETLGLVSTRDGKVTVSKLTKRFPAVFHILALWLRRSWPLADRFPFTSISVNKNYAARMSVSQ